MKFLKSNASSPQEYLENDFGMVSTMDSISNDPDGFAEVFSESSPALKELLLRLWDQGVETSGCCAGHAEAHTYTKNTVFGNEKEIDKDTFQLYKDSDRYHHHFEEEKHAYLAFRPKDLDTVTGISQGIAYDLSMCTPKIDFRMYTSLHIITVGLSQYVPERERDGFFSALSDVLDRFLPEISKDPAGQGIGVPLPVEYEDLEDDLERVVSPARSLPGGWLWFEWADGSGCLQNPEGEWSVAFDTGRSDGCIDYRKADTPARKVFHGTLEEFKEHAEDIVSQEQRKSMDLQSKIADAADRAKSAPREVRQNERGPDR